MQRQDLRRILHDFNMVLHGLLHSFYMVFTRLHRDSLGSGRESLSPLGAHVPSTCRQLSGMQVLGARAGSPRAAGQVLMASVAVAV